MAVASHGAGNVVHRWFLERGERFRSRVSSPSTGQRRGPETSAELDAKLDLLADVLNGSTVDGPPELLGLAEIQSEQLVDRLEKRLSRDYHTTFESPATACRTGLAVMASKNLFAPPLPVARDDLDTRPFGLITLCRLANRSLLFGINHWPASSGAAGAPRSTANWLALWLGESIATWERNTPFLLVGDFNAEPFERPLNSAFFRGVRFRHLLTERSWLTSMYNTGWSFLSEGRGQPHTSVCSDPSVVAPPMIFDQLLVSRSLVTRQLWPQTERQHREVRCD